MRWCTKLKNNWQGLQDTSLNSKVGFGIANYDFSTINVFCNNKRGSFSLVSSVYSASVLLTNYLKYKY